MALHARVPLGSISVCASRSATDQSRAAEVLLQSHSLFEFCSGINMFPSSRISGLLGVRQAVVRQTRIKSGRQLSSSSASSSSSSSPSSSWSRLARTKSGRQPLSFSCSTSDDVDLLQARYVDLSVKEVCGVEETLFLQRICVDGLDSVVVDVDAAKQNNELGYAQGEVLAEFVKGNFGGLAAAVVVLGLVIGFLNVDSATAATERVSLHADMKALALGPGGPLMEDFWDNVRRYGFYFFTVVTGGLYSLTRPLLDLLKEPSTQILVVIVVLGTFYLLYLTVSTMLGLNDFTYEYAQ